MAFRNPPMFRRKIPDLAATGRPGASVPADLGNATRPSVRGGNESWSLGTNGKRGPAADPLSRTCGRLNRWR